MKDIILCPPLRWPPALIALARTGGYLVDNDGTTTPSYSNSSVAHCSTCNRECWIGPRQSALRDERGTSVQCIVCVACDPSVKDAQIDHLGNPEGEL